MLTIFNIFLVSIEAFLIAAKIDKDLKKKILENWSLTLYFSVLSVYIFFLETNR